MRDGGCRYGSGDCVPVIVAGLVNDIGEVEGSLFGEGDSDPALSQPIYRLLSQVIAFQPR